MRFLNENTNSASQTAWACAVYSMVPYLGIIFVPAALIAGFVAIFLSRQTGSSRKLALVSSWTAAAIFAVQIFLWWLLYYVPTLSRQHP